jgi:uncharacterized protein YegL
MSVDIVKQKLSLFLKSWPILLTLLCALAISPVLASDKHDGVDIVFIMDSSGSMKQNDAHRLRVQAAKMFINLLDENDRAAIISFSGKAYRVTPLLELKSSRNEKRLLKAIDKVSDRGAFTNIYDALDQGYQMLKQKKSAERKQHIVLMSDGRMDVGHDETDLRLTEKTLDDIGPQLAKSRVKVHTVTFSRASNHALMKLVAEDTKGTFSLIAHSSEIHEIFGRIFERSKKPEQLPVNEDSFIVDDHINEVTVVVSKHRSNAHVALETPDGDEISKDSRHPDVRWFHASEFDLITIRNPSSGYWLIKYSEGGNKAYIITELKLLLQASNEVQIHMPFVAQAWLEKENKLLRRSAVIGSTHFKLRVTHPNGKTTVHALSDDGIDGDDRARDGYHSSELIFNEPGKYKLDAIVTGETFDRQKSSIVTVKAPVTHGDPFEVQDQEESAPEIHLPVTDVVATPAVEPPPAVVSEPKHHEPAAKTDADADKPVEHPEEISEEHVEEESNWLQGLLIFLLVNVIIGVIGGGVWYWLKQKKAKAAEENKDDGDKLETDLAEEGSEDNAETTAASNTEMDTSEATDKNQ